MVRIRCRRGGAHAPASRRCHDHRDGNGTEFSDHTAADEHDDLDDGDYERSVDDTNDDHDESVHDHDDPYYESVHDHDDPYYESVRHILERRDE
ncbi:hypothetical protein GS489_30850 [Rhodococcus hoagii]|nr:hypothetical protein [Prescottella equi]